MLQQDLFPVIASPFFL